MFGNFVAHRIVWDLPYLGHVYAAAEKQPFKLNNKAGYEGWCSANTGAGCTLDDLLICADLPHDYGTSISISKIALFQTGQIWI